MNFIGYLERNINNDMSLPDIINVFEKMCEEPLENDMILYETGTFSFTGEPLFYFSIVRQFPNDEEEYCQIHVDVLFKPDVDNKFFSEAVWDEEIDENIFDYIRKSKAYKYAEKEKHLTVNIYMDET